MIHHIGVVAGPADQGVRTRAAIEDVGGGIAGQGVGQFVAGEVHGGSAEQQGVFDIGRQAVADRGLDQIAAFVGQFDDFVTDVVDDVDIVVRATAEAVRPETAVQPVIAGATLQDIDRCVADQGVVPVVADHAEGPDAGDGHVLDVEQVVLAQVDHAGRRLGGVGDIELVGAVIGVFLYQRQFRSLIKVIGVVATAADQRVDAEPAIEEVVAVVADQHVVQGVAGAVEVIAAGEGQVFQVGTEGVADRSHHGVDFARQGAGFADDVLEVVDDVSVVAGAADHPVGAEAAVEHVVAAVAEQDVVQGVAGAVDVGAAGQGQVFDVGTKGVVDRSLDGVDFGQRSAGFDHVIADVIHHIGVVAGPADQGVRTAHAVEHVVQRIAGQHIVKGRACGVFDFRAVGNCQAVIYERLIHPIDECLADLAECALVEVQVNGGQLVAGVDRVGAARIPDSLKHRLVRCPAIDVVTGLPKHVGAIHFLDDKNIQQHRRSRLIGVRVAVTHDREM